MRTEANGAGTCDNGPMRSVEHVNDPSTVKQIALLYERELEKLFERYQVALRELAELKGTDAQGTLAVELERLKAQLDRARQREFGESTERRGRGREDQDDDQDDADAPKGHGPTEQPDLPIRDEVHELDPDDRGCPACGGDLDVFEGQLEEADEITVIERRYEIVRHRRQKYRCRCNGAVVTAPGPQRLIPGGRYSWDFAAQVALDKYLWHIPLERQVRMMADRGLRVTSQTLWDQIEALARRLEPYYEELGRRVRAAPVVHADETTWRVMGENGGRGSKRWYSWCLTSEDTVYHRIEPSRGASVAIELLGDYQGVVLTDGYAGYQKLARLNPGIRLAHCWAHVRRKYLEAEPNWPECAEVLDLIDELFRVERGLPGLQGLEGADLEDALGEIRTVRDARSRPVVGRIQDWVLTRRSTPGTDLAGATRYAQGLWPGLVRFLEEPRVPLSNNAVERALRGQCLGRKNHYGSRSRRGTEVAATFYSVVETAKLREMAPRGLLLEIS